MMVVLGNIVMLIYLTCLAVISIYCLMQFHLLLHYLTKNKSEELISEPVASEDLPFVTVQLPLYNEYFVVNRLIDNITQLDYPKDRFEIQVIDDSTDESMDLAKTKVEEYQAQGYHIELVTRSDRVGYKAGALKAAMSKVRGEFIAIFDADFLPEKDFLKKTLPYFNKYEKLAVVQTRWGHINQNHSLLTKVQAFQLNVHFTVEQKGRQLADYFLQFNGTAGVWRKAAIEDAGGWEADTLTEDLDLSYRAQLKGWKIIFLQDTIAPAELPSEMLGLKSQQHRWMKGGAETAKKLLPKVWASPINFISKIHGSIHLLGSSVFLSIFLLGVFSVPLIFVVLPFSATVMNTFLFSTLLIFIIYYTANVGKAWEGQSKLMSFVKFIFIFPIFLSLSMGLSFHNSIAVLQGYLGRKSAFIRTPKFNIKKITDKVRDKKYHNYTISKVTMMEGALSLYFLLAIIAGLTTGNLAMVPFHIMLFFGYGAIFFFTIKHLSAQ